MHTYKLRYIVTGSNRTIWTEHRDARSAYYTMRHMVRLARRLGYAMTISMWRVD